MVAARFGENRRPKAYPSGVPGPGTEMPLCRGVGADCHRVALGFEGVGAGLGPVRRERTAGE